MSLYDSIRNIFNAILIIIIIVLIVRKFKYSSRRFKFSLLAIYLVISMVSSLPIENLFIDYSSPDDVFAYKCSGIIKDKVYGKNSCMIVYEEKANTYESFIIVPGNNSSYKIPYNWTGDKVLKNIEAENVSAVYNVSKTNDYYLYGYCYFQKNNTFSISDNFQSDIKAIVTYNKDTSYYTYYYYAMINKKSNNFDNYYLTINDKKFYLK